MNNPLKFMAQCLNWEATKLPGILKRYNSKPILINNSSAVHHGPDNVWIEQVVNIHKFSYIARKVGTGAFDCRSCLMRAPALDCCSIPTRFLHGSCMHTPSRLRVACHAASIAGCHVHGRTAGLKQHLEQNRKHSLSHRRMHRGAHAAAITTGSPLPSPLPLPWHANASLASPQNWQSYIERATASETRTP